MKKLTEKTRHGYASLETGQISECSNKLGELEDLMEKYEIDDINALEKIIKDYDDMAKAVVEMGLGIKVEIKESYNE